MKIISWNCNLNIKGKFELIERYNPVIVFVQECEKLPLNYFPKYKYLWIGKNDKKGMAVMINGGSAKIDDRYNESFIYFLPINSDLGNILGVWAYNHRAQKKFGNGFHGETSKAISYYSNFLNQDKTSLLAGDFNNSIIWDRKNSSNTFKKSIKEIEDKGFISSYHSNYGDEFGKESLKTFFHTKKQSLGYHIDFIFSRKKISSFCLGSFEEWIKYSDHMPLICEI